MFWNLFPFKGDFSFGKSQKLKGTKSGLQRDWVTWVIWYFAKKLCPRYDEWADVLSWWSCQSPVAHCCGLLNHANSFHGEMLKLNAKFDGDPFLYSVILSVTATQYTCSLNSLYRPHCLVQWSCCCSHMHIPVHSPWLPGYMDVAQTILIIITMVGLFLDNHPQTCVCVITWNMFISLQWFFCFF